MATAKIRLNSRGFNIIMSTIWIRIGQEDSTSEWMRMVRPVQHGVEHEPLKWRSHDADKGALIG